MGDMKEALDRGCVVSKKLCRRSNLAEMVTTQTSCQWSDWTNRDHPSGHCDCEGHARFGYTFQTVGPGKQCEVSEYRVRIRGTTTEYSDVNSLPPHNPTGISYVIKSSSLQLQQQVHCNNRDQTWRGNCGYPYPKVTCCPDLEVKYCCKRNVEVPEPKPCSCMCCPCFGPRCAEEIDEDHEDHEDQEDQEDYEDHEDNEDHVEMEGSTSHEVNPFNG